VTWLVVLSVIGGQLSSVGRASSDQLGHEAMIATPVS
jgi:hypothetical protein